jgi:hypothetical protein
VGAGAQQPPPSGPLTAWGATLARDERALEELGRFHEGGALGSEYRIALSELVRSELFAAAERALGSIEAEGCRPSVSVTLPAFGEGTGVLPRSATAERFEQSTIRVESVTCIDVGSTSSGDALDLYVSPEFRQAAESRIEEITSRGGERCERTGGTFPLLSPTHSCASVTRFDDERLSSQHSQVVSNAGKDGEQPVYFKESLKTAVRIPGGVAIHHVHYSRSVNLGRLERWVAQGKVRDAEEKTLRLLRERMSASPR